MVGRRRPGADEVPAGGGGQDPRGGEHAGPVRHDHHRHVERVRQGAGVERPGPAERHQRQASWIDAPLDGDPPDGQLHVRVDHPDDALGGHARPRERRAGRTGVEAAEVAEGGVDRDAAEHEVGVGDGGGLAAPPVAGGARLRAGRGGTDHQRAAGVDPGDRSTAGPDRVDVERRHPDRVAADHPPRRRLGTAAEHQAHVGRRAAHVEGDRVGMAVGGRRVGGGPHAARRPRQEQGDRPLGGVEHRHEPAGRAHDRDLSRGRGQAAQVGAAAGPQHGVDDGRDRPLVLAELGGHLVGAGDVPAAGSQGRRRRDLVRRVEVGVQQADRHRLGRAHRPAGGAGGRRRRSARSASRRCSDSTSIRCTSAPSADSRSRTPSRQARGTSGTGRSAKGS